MSCYNQDMMPRRRNYVKKSGNYWIAFLCSSKPGRDRGNALAYAAALLRSRTRNARQTCTRTLGVCRLPPRNRERLAPPAMRRGMVHRRIRSRGLCLVMGVHETRRSKGGYGEFSLPEHEEGPVLLRFRVL